MDYLEKIIKPGMTLNYIREEGEAKMKEMGADCFWYYDIGVFIFSGEETLKSIAGNKYKTLDSTIKENDILTIDLSPQKDNVWGDYARTIIVENGLVVKNIADIKNAEWREGLEMENTLHDILIKYVTRDTTFQELFFYMNDYIKQNLYINLDFMGNLGHSIESKKSKRMYIKKGNEHKLSQVKMFTFEPHISRNNGKYGYKKENIYYFNGDCLCELNAT